MNSIQLIGGEFLPMSLNLSLLYTWQIEICKMDLHHLNCILMKSMCNNYEKLSLKVHKTLIVIDVPHMILKGLSNCWKSKWKTPSVKWTLVNKHA